MFLARIVMPRSRSRSVAVHTPVPATRSFDAERAALMQQRIYERRLAMIDVGDDGDIPAKWVGDVAAVRRLESFQRTRASVQYTESSRSGRSDRSDRSVVLIVRMARYLRRASSSRARSPN